MREFPQTPRHFPWDLRDSRKRHGIFRETCGTPANATAFPVRLAGTPANATAFPVGLAGTPANATAFPVRLAGTPAKATAVTYRGAPPHERIKRKA